MSTSTFATIVDSTTLDVRSEASGIDYRLRVAWPRATPPAGGLPTLVVLDGDAYFGTVTETSRNLAQFGAEICPALVVAIGYADSPDAWHFRRLYDYTPSRPGPEDPSVDGARYGGLDQFLLWMEHAITNVIAPRWYIDPHRTVLLGHSLGGLAVVHALLTRPGMCGGYAAISPALYWNESTVLQAEVKFIERIHCGAALPRVFLAAGGLEDVGRSICVNGSDETVRRAAITHAQIRDRTKSFAARLRAIDPDRVNWIRYTSPVAETHVSVFSAVLASALRHVLPPEISEFGRV